MPNGVDEGWIYINQDARQDDKSFDGSGVSTVYGLDGSLLETTSAQVSADRTSADVPSFCS